MFGMSKVSVLPQDRQSVIVAYADVVPIQDMPVEKATNAVAVEQHTQYWDRELQVGYQDPGLSGPSKFMSN